MGTGDGERLREVLRLPREGDSEEPVRRIRLEAVLGQPDALRAVEPGELPDQDVDVPSVTAVPFKGGGVRGVSLRWP